MQNPNDYRQWPNVLALNDQIKAMGLKLSQAVDQNEIMHLRHQLNRLISKRYDQVQFNKELFYSQKEAA